MTGFSIHTLLRRALSVIFLITTLSSIAYSQNETDTLSTIVVKQTRKGNASVNAKYSPGTRVQKFTEISQTTSNNSLSDFLKNRTALNIKEYGRGMSSYLSVRGTSSSHTSIDWNGQSLAVPTMGQTDLSHIPIYFFDNMSIHIGGSSALYGSGSLSGNIQLKTTPTYNEGVSGDITLKGGSFSTLFGGGTIRFGKKSWESRTSAYYSYAKNNYKFYNNTKIGYPRERLKNAAYNNWGVLQEAFKRFKDNSQLQISIMHLEFDREIQPSVSNNNIEKAYHSILDRNTKVSANYSGNSNNRWFYTAAFAYGHDYELYEDDIIEADRILSKVSGEFKSNSVSVRAGVSAEYIKPGVNAYASGTKEWREELYALVLWRPLQNLALGGGVRGSFVTDMDIPIQPGFDIRYTIINPYREGNRREQLTGTSSYTAAQHTLSVRGSVSQSSKIPTLNDRYWGGVTAGLNPEKAFTCEVGADYSLLFKSVEVTSFITLYKSDVKDWIRWLPAGEIWRPQNVPEVESQGIEAGLDITRKWIDWRIRLGSSYNYTNVEMRKSLYDNDPSVGKQMAYQPKHSFRANLEARYKTVTAALNYSYTGEKTSTDIYDIMQAYSLVDISLQYDFTAWGNNFCASGEVKNIFNADYQNVRFYAMPGINFALGLQLKF